MSRLVLCGCGTVGLRVLQLIEKLKPPVTVEAVFVRNASKKREGLQEEYNFTSNVDDILNSNADLIVEVMGGTDEASIIVENALQKGKRVVTANKALLFKSLQDASKDGGASLLDKHSDSLFYEAAVAGGIPIIRSLQSAYFLNVHQIQGILNGTCNFILDSMTRENLDYKDALQLAQEKGFAEADPFLDVEGVDAFQKLSILSKLAFDAAPDESFHHIGISGIKSVDIAYAVEMGCVIRHVCNAEIVAEDKLSVSCLPAVLHRGDDLVVSGPMNVVQVNGGMPLVLKGEGAGGTPTANSVYADIADALRDTKSFSGAFNQSAMLSGSALTFCAPRGQFFLRFTVIDECGIIADVGEECRRLNININSILQHPESGPLCNFVVVTEETDLDTVKDLMKNLQEGHSWFQSSFIALLHSKC